MRPLVSPAGLLNLTPPFGAGGWGGGAWKGRPASSASAAPQVMTEVINCGHYSFERLSGLAGPVRLGLEAPPAESPRVHWAGPTRAPRRRRRGGAWKGPAIRACGGPGRQRRASGAVGPLRSLDALLGFGTWGCPAMAPMNESKLWRWSRRVKSV